MGPKAEAARGGGLASCLVLSSYPGTGSCVVLSRPQGRATPSVATALQTVLSLARLSHQQGEGRVREILRSLRVLGGLVICVPVRSSIEVEMAIRVASLGCWGSAK